MGGKKFKLGKSLRQEAQDQIVEVIARHMDAFTWSTSDMPGIDPDFCAIASPWTQRSDVSARNEESSMMIGDRSSKKRPRSC